MPAPPFATRNGWRLSMYPAFEQPYGALVDEVERLAARDPAGHVAHPKAKLLGRINELILDEIPSDPGNPTYRRGGALGTRHKDWFRAKFLTRFRLFFRYSTASRTIIYCWVNDEHTLRKAGSETDPYEVFAKMLRSGRPPRDWDDLVKTVSG